MEKIEEIFMVAPNSWINALPDYQKMQLINYIA